MSKPLPSCRVTEQKSSLAQAGPGADGARPARVPSSRGPTNNHQPECWGEAGSSSLCARTSHEPFGNSLSAVFKNSSRYRALVNRNVILLPADFQSSALVPPQPIRTLRSPWAYWLSERKQWTTARSSVRQVTLKWNRSWSRGIFILPSDGLPLFRVQIVAAPLERNPRLT